MPLYEIQPSVIGDVMQFMNIVKFQVKPECVADFIAAMQNQPKWDGNIEMRVVQTGDNHFCGCGLWESKDVMLASMDSMVAWLDTIRPMLEVISEELGLTDPASGPVIITR